MPPRWFLFLSNNVKYYNPLKKIIMSHMSVKVVLLEIDVKKFARKLWSEIIFNSGKWVVSVCSNAVFYSTKITPRLKITQTEVSNKQ